MKNSFIRRLAGILNNSLNPNGVSSYLELISPILSRRQCFAKVIQVEQLNSDTVILTLRANTLWRGNRAGQFIGVGVIFQGVRHIRYYSPLTSGRSSIIRIGISRHPHGIMSNYLVDHAYPGMMVSLSKANGEFTLPSQLPSQIRLLSAGSGFTAILALLEYLVTIRYSGELVIVHYGPTRASIPCVELFHQLVEKLPRASFRLGITQEDMFEKYSQPFSKGNVSEQAELIQVFYGRILAEHCAPLDSTDIVTYACGPQGFVEAASRITSSEYFHSETFTPVLAAVTADVTGTTVTIECKKSHTEVIADCGQSILDSVLQAGIPAQYGCKMGICFSCTTIKNRGIVRNALTNEVDAEPNVSIQLCISLPESEIELEL